MQTDNCKIENPLVLLLTIWWLRTVDKDKTKITKLIFRFKISSPISTVKWGIKDGKQASHFEDSQETQKHRKENTDRGE